jgi:hypothetical protein
MGMFSVEHRQLRRLQLLLIAILFTRALFLTTPASASLGNGLDSVYRDAAHASSGLQVTNTEHYSIYELKISTGTRVREYISPEGVVFAVAWDGPFVPELQQFLGTNFQKCADALHAQKPTYFSRKPVSIRLNDLVFENSGHVGAFYGRAYLPQTMPQGVVIAELH